MLDVVQVPVLNDNYIYLIRCVQSDVVGVVDPAEAAPVLAELAQRGWSLSWILNTHHHADHVGGNLELKAKTSCRVVGPRADARRIPGIDVQLGDGDTFALGEVKAQVFDVPGHTRGHIAFWFSGAEALFCGDTLFSLGCGRLFEGDAKTMWASLQKLRQLPEAAKVYCAHEYTAANWRFATTIEPQNEALKKRGAWIEARRAARQATVPSTLGDELACNPFLRVDQPEVRRTLGSPWREASDSEVFGELRRRKDHFAG